MSRSLLRGGGLAAVALLSASLIVSATPSVAETLAFITEHQDAQQQSDAQAQKPQSEGVTSAEEAEGKQGKTEEAAAPASETEQAGPPQTFTATAYSLRGRTASGRPVSKGVIAADRKVLPLGTRVRLHAGSYSGDYVVADTGGVVRGRKIDIWMPSTREAMRFGRRPVKLTVLTKVRPKTTKPKSGK